MKSSTRPCVAVFLVGAVLIWPANFVSAQSGSSQPSKGVTPSPQILEALEALPQDGNQASVTRREGKLIVVAVGIGYFNPKNENQKSLPDAVKRVNAIRAAVVNAKAAVAEFINSSLATDSTFFSTDTSTKVKEETLKQIGRTLLSGSCVWKSQAVQTEDGMRGCVRIFFPQELSAQELISSKNVSHYHGVPRFADHDAAVLQIYEWVSNGMCEVGPLYLFVGPSGQEKLQTFAVGIAGTSVKGARTIAVSNATRALVAASKSMVEGSSKLTLRAAIQDPLSNEGGSALFQEEFFSERRTSSVTVIKNATRIEELPSGITCTVVWDTSTKD